jgi:hypothetical protein
MTVKFAEAILHKPYFFQCYFSLVRRVALISEK